MSEIQSQMSRQIRNKVVISFLITILAIIATFVVANSVTKLIERLKDVADKVNMGDYSKSLKSLVTLRSANWHNHSRG
jgi:HAMP domain-containing protein